MEKERIPYLTQEELEKANPEIDWSNPPSNALGTVNYYIYLQNLKKDEGGNEK